MPQVGSQAPKNQPSVLQFTDAKQVLTEDIGTSTEDKVEFSIQIQAHIKALVKLTRQQTKAQHHIEILTIAIDKEHPPKGLVPRVTLKIPNITAQFLINWEEELHRCSIKLTKQLLRYWQERLTELQTEIAMLDKKLIEKTTGEQALKVNDILQEVVEATKQEIKRKKPKPKREIATARRGKRQNQGNQGEEGGSNAQAEI